MLAKRDADEKCTLNPYLYMYLILSYTCMNRQSIKLCDLCTFLHISTHTACEEMKREMIRIGCYLHSTLTRQQDKCVIIRHAWQAA
jgi:hypothetical protein